MGKTAKPHNTGLHNSVKNCSWKIDLMKKEVLFLSTNCEISQLNKIELKTLKIDENGKVKLRMVDVFFRCIIRSNLCFLLEISGSGPSQGWVPRVIPSFSRAGRISRRAFNNI